MPDWSAFAGVVAVVLTTLLALARRSQRQFDAVERDDRPPSGPDVASAPATARPEPRRRPSPRALLASVTASQLVFATVLIGGAWIAAVPPRALGLGRLTPTTVGAGVALGLGLALANAAGEWVGEAVGIAADERLRALLTPETRAGWLLLFGVVLPVVAGFEELLFRGALVGALHAGFGVSPWLLAVGSSVAFALGHGAQGRVGVAVTGLLGFVLAAAFVVTGSLVTVVVAHYLVNALEFVGSGWRPVAT